MTDFLTRTAEINVKGWEVNNCFQLNNRWRVNIRHTERKEFSAFGDGETPDDALRRAIKSVDLDGVPSAETEQEALDDLLG